MSHSTLGPMAIDGRNQTHRSKLMTLWVTRQNQEFITSSDLQFADVELINATCELVGEPGTGFNGNTTSNHQVNTNSLVINNQGTTSTIYGLQIENRIQTKSRIHHGHVNVSIDGMTEGHQFRQDELLADNKLELPIPTDLGLEATRSALASWPPTPILLERVKLATRLRVRAHFFGNASVANRASVFVEDWADVPLAGVTKRNIDGSVQYIVGDAETNGSAAVCQVPASCIKAIKLVFKIMPRTIL